MGLLKSLNIGNERSYLTSDWSELTFDPTSKSLRLSVRKGENPRLLMALASMM